MSNYGSMMPPSRPRLPTPRGNMPRRFQEEPAWKRPRQMAPSAALPSTVQEMPKQLATAQHAASQPALLSLIASGGVPGYAGAPTLYRAAGTLPTGTPGAKAKSASFVPQVLTPTVFELGGTGQFQARMPSGAVGFAASAPAAAFTAPGHAQQQATQLLMQAMQVGSSLANYSPMAPPATGGVTTHGYASVAGAVSRATAATLTTSTAAGANTAELEIEYDVGDHVNYWSSTSSRWVPTTVQAKRKTKGGFNVYDLGCKKNIKAKHLRPAPPQEATGSGKMLPGGGQKRRDKRHEDENVWELLEEVLPTPEKKGRTEARNAAEALTPGTRVEYWSNKHAKWIPAKIRSLHMGASAKAEMYDLDCKAKVPAQRVRLPSAAGGRGSAGKERAQATFAVGDKVWYYSDRAAKWVKTKVKVVNPAKDGRRATYDLDAKKKVSASRMRHYGASGGAALKGRLLRSGQAKQLAKRKRPRDETAKPSGVKAPKRNYDFAPGDFVRYWSKRNTKWIKATVVKKHQNGSGPFYYDLKCKGMNVTGAQCNRIRPMPKGWPTKGAGVPGAQAVAPKFALGHDVWYWSDTGTQWIRARVTHVRTEPNGTVTSVDTSAKAQVEPWKLRLFSESKEEPKGPPVQPKTRPKASSGMRYRTGSQVLYWSRKSSEWVDAIVQAKRKHGDVIAYDLRSKKMEVKGAPASRLKSAVGRPRLKLPPPTAKADQASRPPPDGGELGHI